MCASSAPKEHTRMTSTIVKKAWRRVDPVQICLPVAGGIFLFFFFQSFCSLSLGIEEVNDEKKSGGDFLHTRREKKAAKKKKKERREQSRAEREILSLSLSLAPSLSLSVLLPVVFSLFQSRRWIFQVRSMSRKGQLNAQTSWEKKRVLKQNKKKKKKSNGETAVSSSASTAATAACDEPKKKKILFLRPLLTLFFRSLF